MASRIAACFLRSLNLESLIAGTVEEYERKALALAREPQKLAQLREGVAARRRGAPLFDTAGRVAAFGRAIEAIVTRARAGLAPAPLEV
jgi:predicted O-linked N-acetylglucosamine transferase (SPINDLY family)